VMCRTLPKDDVKKSIIETNRLQATALTALDSHRF